MTRQAGFLKWVIGAALCCVVVVWLYVKPERVVSCKGFVCDYDFYADASGPDWRVFPIIAVKTVLILSEKRIVVVVDKVPSNSRPMTYEEEDRARKSGVVFLVGLAAVGIFLYLIFNKMRKRYAISDKKEGNDKCKP